MTNILTLRIDPASRAHFNHLRQLHYPPTLNQIDAHITLLHTLPDTPDIDALLETIAARQAPFAASVTGLRSLGKGVAYKLDSPTLLSLHRQLAEAFQDHLTPQDNQKFQPHIVVQNKATSEKARALLATLERTFHALEITAEGMDVWHYLGGPWKLARSFPFDPLNTSTDDAIF